MTLPSVDVETSSATLQPAEAVKPHWYAAYTRGNHERRVAAELASKGVQHFLPLYSSFRRWSDRRVRLDVPLFPGYVFVRLALEERLRVARVNGVVRLVGFSGQPVALPDEEMETLRSGLSQALHAEPHPYLTVGRRVRITRGVLKGMEGILIRKKGRIRLVLSIALIHQSAMIEVDSEDVGPV
jgi:transcription antitermination factor NusG